MKKLIIWVLGIIGLFGTGCSDELDSFYGERDCIYFQEFIYNTLGNKVEYDSILYTFGNKMSDVVVDTVKVVVCYTGRKAGQDRTYRVVVADTGMVKSGKTTMEAGKDYDPIAELQVMPANSWTDTLQIVLHREYLDPSHRKQLSKCLMLRMEETEDFGVGNIENSELKLVANNYLTEPLWWEGVKGYLGYYHPVKWQVLISFNEDFDNSDAISQTIDNFQIQTKYGPALRSWLEDHRPIDEEANAYILMDALVPVE